MLSCTDSVSRETSKTLLLVKKVDVSKQLTIFLKSSILDGASYIRLHKLKRLRIIKIQDYQDILNKVCFSGLASLYFASLGFFTYLKTIVQHMEYTNTANLL